MNVSQESLSLLKQDLQHTKTFKLVKTKNKQLLIRTQKMELL